MKATWDAQTLPDLWLRSLFLLPVLTIATWFAWLGWDTARDYDPVTGEGTGPYQAWQVIGCGVTFVTLAVAAGVFLRPVTPFLVMPLTFTAAWSVPASSDTSGLWVLGAFVLLVGTAVVTAVLGVFAAAIRRKLAWDD